MPTIFQSAVVPCNASVLASAPSIVPLGFTPMVVRVVRIVIPDGHSGLTGIALGYGNNNVLPSGNQAFYSGNDRNIVLDYIDGQQGVAWQAIVCNLDTIAHAWEVNFDGDTLSDNAPTPVIVPLTPAAIIAAGTPTTTGP